MRGRFISFAVAILTVLAVASARRAHAVITVDTPLKTIEGTAVYILVGKVEKYFPEKPAMLVTAIEDIKGRAPFRNLPINCKVAEEKTTKKNLIEPLLKRFGPDLEIIFFVTRPRDEKNHITFAFTNGTWFQVLGTQVGGKDQVVFRLISAEPYFRKSFQGTTAELKKLLKDHAAGKAKLPPIDAKVKPGLGPEYMPKTGALHPHESLRSSSGLAGAGGAPFAVIPTLGIGAPLAILALLFPTVFGGVFVLFRQWLAFITLISLNSTLMLLHMWLAPIFLRGTWWGSDAALWFLMTICTFVCASWAWRRQLNSLSAGDAETPPKTELLILLFMSLSCLAASAFVGLTARQLSWADLGWTLTVVMTLGIVAGTAYRYVHAWKGDTLFAAPPLATEGVILGAMLAGHLAFVPAIWGRNVNTEGSIVVNEQAANTTVKISAVKQKWVYAVDPFIKGMYASSPVLDGDAIYASFSEVQPPLATLVRLDRHSGVKKWEFVGTDGKFVRQMISTPCLAVGNLYFGEGFHFDENCHVFCVDAEKGEEVWRFKTAGQTESSPAVANGRVYIGAGNDGVYCLDAKKGTKIWRYPPDDYQGRLLRFGGGMRVVGNKLYCGTGVDRAQSGDKGETAVFCFDIETDKLLWKSPAPFPVWSTPVVKDGLIYVTSGNGDVFSDAEAPEIPGGALQCFDEAGVEKWRVKVDNGIIESPAIDGHRIYFGCRDGQIYCVNRTDGKERWKRFLESPVIATPVLDSDPVYERTVSVFAIAAAGKVFCLNPQTGDAVWTFTPNEPAYVSTAPRLVVTRTPAGYRRQIYFGCGLGGGMRDLIANRPVFYCLEDHVNVE